MLPYQINAYFYHDVSTMLLSSYETSIGCCSIIIMSEELPYELFKWLGNLEVTPPNLRYKPNGNYELDTRTKDALLNGYLPSKLLLTLAQQLEAVVNQPLLASIKQSNTPAARMYNWNILAEGFTKLNVAVGKEAQKEIIAGNFQSLLRFLLQLHQKFSPKKVQKREESLGKSDLNLKRLQGLQSYDEADTFLELVVLVLSDKLSLSPKQAVSALNDHGKFYAHMVVKGVKNSFEDVLSLLEALTQQIPQLMFLCEKDPQKNTEFLLDMVKPTLISREADVARCGARLLAGIIEESLKYNSKNLIYQLICREAGGFDFLYMALKRHPDLVTDFTGFLFPLVSHALTDFFEVHLRRTINNQQEYLKVVLRLLEGLAGETASKAALRESGLLETWLDSCEASFGNKLSREEDFINEETKLLYLQLLCNLWKEYSGEIDQEYAQDLLVKGINELKKNTRRDIYTVRIPALLRLFDFLKFLADTKSRLASIVYKKLIFLLIENHDEPEVRQIILDNFGDILKKYPTIPIDLLLEPLLRQLISSEGRSYVLNVFDFQFIVEVCRHPRMDTSFALSYLEYFSGLYIKSFIYARLTIRVIQILTSRFCEEETIIEFIKKTADKTLNHYSLLTFQKKKTTREERIINQQRQSLSIELIKHFLQLQHPELQQHILHRVTALYLLWIDSRKHHNKGLRHLIELMGDLEETCIQHKIRQSNLLGQNTLPLHEPSSPPSPQNPSSRVYYEEEYMKQKGIGYKQSSHPHKKQVNSMLDVSALKAAPSAIQQLQKIKEKMRDGASRKREQEEQELRRLREKNNLNSLELLQRNLSLGYTKIPSQVSDQMVFQFDSVKPKQLKVGSRFYGVEELEAGDQESAQTVLRVYSKDIRLLFLRYALLSGRGESGREEEAVMGFTEVIKLLNEKGVGVVNKLIISDLLASINHARRKERNILHGVQEADFHEFLLKLTDYLVQHELNAPEVPLGTRLEQLLKTLFTGENFYDNRFRNKEDASIIQMKEGLRRGEDLTDIPEGYKKVRETRVQLNYQVGEPSWGVEEGFRVGYEMVDWLIHRALGTHVVAPKVEIKQAYTLIQIPKPVRTHKPAESQQDKGEVPSNSPDRPKQKKETKTDRRSQSQRAIVHKVKTDPVQTGEDKAKAVKREKYLDQLRGNVERLREEKKVKEEVEKKSHTEKVEENRKKEERNKDYRSANKEKIKHFREREEQQQQQKKEQEKRSKEQAQGEHQRKGKELLGKHQEQIQQYALKVSEKKRHLESSRERQDKQSQQLRTNTNTIASTSVQSDKLKMQEVKNSLESGCLHDVLVEFEGQLTELFQAYWNWEQKRIGLNSMALMLKDFRISPEYILPKTLSETYKGIGKGQTLDYTAFAECLAKCAYKSDKLNQDDEGEGQKPLTGGVLQLLMSELRMKEWNYKEVLRTVKMHIE